MKLGYSGHCYSFQSRCLNFTCHWVSPDLGSNFNRDGAYGWASLLEGPLTVANVPCTHETIVLEPNVRELARTLSHYVLSADATRALSQVKQKELELKEEPA